MSSARVPSPPTYGDRGAAQLSVREALALPELLNGLPRVLSGESELDRPIRWVHAGEVPHIASLLKGGELLLTTGMGIGGRDAEQRALIDALADLQIAALVVELGHRFTAALPEALVDQAIVRNLPVVQLHAEVPFVAVTEAIHTALINQRYEDLRRAGQLGLEFTALMLNGRGIPGVLERVAEVAGNPVVLEDNEGRLLHIATPPDFPGHIDPAMAWAQAARTGAFSLASAAIPAPDERPNGRLIVLPLARELEPIVALVAERAAEAVALALMRAQQENELVAGARGEFLVELASGRVRPARVTEHARLMGFTCAPPQLLLPIVVQLPALLGLGGRRSPGRPWIHARDSERALLQLGLPTLVGLDREGGVLLVLLGIASPTKRLETVDAAVGAIHSALGDADGRVIIVAGAAGDWAEVGTNLRRAIASVGAAGARKGTSSWHDASSMRVERLLWSCREHGFLEDYVDELLGRVLDHDADARSPLLPTLEALCELGGQKSSAARQLHLNRQSLYKRVDRLEHILGVDLSDAATVHALHLAIVAFRYLSISRTSTSG